jgi:Arc/MetJ family transcription regulator
MTPRGNPKLQIRLDPDLMERVQEAFPAVSGRSGGVALAVRQLLHLVLDEPIPHQYGEVRRSELLDRMEETVRRLERGEEALDNIEAQKKLVQSQSDAHQSPVDLLRIRSLLGRLYHLEMD